MYIPKRYGQSKSNKCPFCGTEAVFKNSQGVPVCRRHKDSSLESMKCLCGSTLEPKDGKFGPYFSCMKCGNVNFKRAMEINKDLMERKINNQSAPMTSADQTTSRTQSSSRLNSSQEKKQPKEVVVRSDELDFMYE